VSSHEESFRGESSRGESSRGESSRGESSRGESSRGESSRGESSFEEKSLGEGSLLGVEVSLLGVVVPRLLRGVGVRELILWVVSVQKTMLQKAINPKEHRRKAPWII